MFQVVKKLRMLKHPLKKLSWEKGIVYERVINLREQLKEVQCKIDKDPHDKKLRLKEADPLKEFLEAEADEESFLFQQAKIQWLCEGDKNTKFFHNVLKGRTNKSKIHNIYDNEGVLHVGDKVATKFVKHFEKFLGQEHQVEELDAVGLFSNKLGTGDAMSMIREVTEVEIKKAMFDIDDGKAPGPDGFTSTFFKKAWGIIGHDVCSEVKEFFDKGQMLKELNATLISLIPKVQNPSKVTDFRPIACCNVLYKCISKVLTNRIKHVLTKLVSNNQSAFIPGRQIQDNILLTQEIMKGYNRKNGPKRVALKIDIQKAYDTMNWEFLRKILLEFGFHIKMVEWIMQCVTTTTFTINVNGERIGYFKVARGLRQGDPMSPYLFTLIMEIFTLVLKRKINRSREFHYHFGCKDMKLTHVCFATDLLVMCHGDLHQLVLLKRLLRNSVHTQVLYLIFLKVQFFWGVCRRKIKKPFLIFFFL